MPALFLLIIFYVVGLGFALALGFKFPIFVWTGTLLTALFILGSALAHRNEWRFIATWLGTNAIVYGQALPAMLVLISVATFPRPWADDWLARMDANMGFKAPDVVFALKPISQLVWPAYISFGVQPIFILPLLAAFDQKRCWTYVTAGIVAMSITCLLFTFTPALGTFRHFRITPQLYPPFTYESAPYTFGHALILLRNGYRIVSPGVLTGLVSFPSYHAAAAALAVWSIWGFRIMRIPFLLINAALIVGCFIFGAHYLADVLAGIVVAIASVLIAGGQRGGLKFFLELKKYDSNRH